SNQGPVAPIFTPAVWRSTTQIACDKPVFPLAGARLQLEISPNCKQFVTAIAAGEPNYDKLLP
ncbi:unnamed protein product, partial [Amoebophrya sp. A120]